jgi:hypothetical protein
MHKIYFLNHCHKELNARYEAIEKVTSGELLTKQAMRKKIIIYKEYVHT